MFWYQWLRLYTIYSFMFVLQHHKAPKSMKITFEFPLHVVLLQCHESNMAFSQ